MQHRWEHKWCLNMCGPVTLTNHHRLLILFKMVIRRWWNRSLVKHIMNHTCIIAVESCGPLFHISYLKMTPPFPQFLALLLHKHNIICNIYATDWRIAQYHICLRYWDTLILKCSNTTFQRDKKSTCPCQSFLLCFSDSFVARNNISCTSCRQYGFALNSSTCFHVQHSSGMLKNCTGNDTTSRTSCLGLKPWKCEVIFHMASFLYNAVFILQ